MMLPLVNKLLFNGLKPLVTGKVRKACTFRIDLTASHYQGPTDAAVVEAVCRTTIGPLLAASDECFVYGLDESSELLTLAQPILTPARGKHAIRTTGDSVSGYEALFAAAAGARGSILFRVPKGSGLFPSLFRHTYNPWYYDNPGAAHTPSALQYAKRQIRTSPDIFLLLSRSNGLEFLDVVSSPPGIVHLFKQACWRAVFQMTLSEA
jgi:hypothetical protein